MSITFEQLKIKENNIYKNCYKWKDFCNKKRKKFGTSPSRRPASFNFHISNVESQLTQTKRFLHNLICLVKV